MADTRIEWSQRVWNPTTGCDQISPGCDNCYALTMAKRLKAMGQAKYQTDGNPLTSGPGFGVAVHPASLDEPLRWRKPARIFVNSMSDLFHHEVPEGFVGSVWNTMALCERHTFQVLTKRPARARAILNRWAADGWHWRTHTGLWAGPVAGPLPNVWMGTSIENAQYSNRVHHLVQTPAAVRFVSAEPLLGPLTHLPLDGVDWLIVGGESGPGARPLDVGWVRELRDRCAAYGTALFVKQLGSHWAQAAAARHSKGGDPAEWTMDLRVREYPGVVAA